MKRFQFLLMFICLGLFVFPKQQLHAQNAEMSCCSTEKKSDCDMPEHSGKTDDKGDCGKDCCTACFGCTLQVTVYADNTTFAPAENSFSLPAVFFNFNYQEPFLSQNLKEIWQPPKIG